MYGYFGRFILIFVLGLSLFSACAPSHTTTVRSPPTTEKSPVTIHMARDNCPTVSSGYNIAMPPGWSEVTDQNELKNRVLWSFINYNDTCWAEHPLSKT